MHSDGVQRPLLQGRPKGTDSAPRRAEIAVQDAGQGQGTQAGFRRQVVANEAPCFCAIGKSHSTGKHGEIHAGTNDATRKAVSIGRGKQIPKTKRWSVSDAEKTGAKAVEDETNDPKCPASCTEQQLRKGHQGMGIGPNDKIRPTTAGGSKKNKTNLLPE